ncbi:WYL domain-containing protein [Brevibacillus borstelensis]|uniref:WYL domain-containing protein n=1 Tax=Brevibacillus borstelensis TaxID=45462 RepID=UPI0030C33247
MKKELQRAIVQQQHIEIIYLGSQGKASKRTIRPLEFVGDRLKAYCLTRRAPRVFAIENILAIQQVVIRHAAGY